MLEPSEETPTNPCPGGAYTPASEYVRWIVNAKIDSADPDNDPEHNRQTQKIDLKPSRGWFIRWALAMVGITAVALRLRKMLR